MGRAGAFKDRPLWQRIQKIHHEIKERRFPNASNLARTLSVSTKTIQRDLDYLRDELHAPIEFDRQENGYAYTKADYVLPFLPVDGKDLFAIGVAAQVLSLLGATPLARDLKACYARLAELMPPAVRLRPEIVMEKMALRANAYRPVHEETWQAVAESLQKGVSLSVRYRHPGGPAGDARVIRPYALILSGQTGHDWMLLAEDAEQGIVKSFYLARIEDARATTERYAIPKQFDVDRYFRDTFGLFVGGGSPFRFRVRFKREVADEVREISWHPKQTMEAAPDGEAILELPARSIREARRFVLAYGRDAIAVSPPELVADLKKETEAMERLYQSREKEGERAPAAKKIPGVRD